MCIRLRWFLCLAVLAAVTTGALADDPPLLTLTGCLSVGDGGLKATGSWNDPCTEFCWQVSNEVTGDPNIWRYEYTLTVPKCDIRKLFIEASSECEMEFTEDNLFDPRSCPPEWLKDTDVDWFAVKCMGVEAPLYGIKASGCSGYQEVTFKFESDRGPRWGDFYALDGDLLGFPLADVCNAGFFTEDPLDAIVDNGTVCNHILVPDTGNLIPEPATLSVLGIGAIVGSVARRRRR
ncbi:MAG TPA: PEP-CTERM sorting domain-containing protein [Phycisphaerae bacterium]|nr:PEP-CTERM sorting domain-containing protein [Phycisphaerae bacterium]